MQKTYVVVGRQKVCGHKSGETFEYEFNPRHEARLIAAGHIKIVERPKPTPRTAVKSAAPTTTSTTNTPKE